jgi:hypothetical protein
MTFGGRCRPSRAASHAIGVCVMDRAQYTQGKPPLLRDVPCDITCTDQICGYLLRLRFSCPGTECPADIATQISDVNGKVAECGALSAGGSIQQMGCGCFEGLTQDDADRLLRCHPAGGQNTYLMQVRSSTAAAGTAKLSLLFVRRNIIPELGLRSSTTAVRPMGALPPAARNLRDLRASHLQHAPGLLTQGGGRGGGGRGPARAPCLLLAAPLRPLSLKIHTHFPIASACDSP